MYEIKQSKLHSTAQTIYQIVTILIERGVEPSVDVVTEIMYMVDKQMVLDIGRRTSNLTYTNKDNTLRANITDYSSVQNTKTGEFTYYFEVHPSGVIELNTDLDETDADLTPRCIKLLQTYSNASELDLVNWTRDFAFKHPRPDGIIELTAWFSELNADDRFTLMDYISTETHDGFNL